MKKIRYFCLIFGFLFFGMQGVFADCREDCEQTCTYASPEGQTRCVSLCSSQCPAGTTGTPVETGTETSTPATATTTAPGPSDIGITMNPECMLGVGCKMDVAKLFGLKAKTPTNDRTSVLMFVQDAVLASTFFIGTIVTLAFIRSGVLFIVSGRNGDASKRKTAQQGMINAAIGLLLVSASYAIVRLIQFLASGG